MGGTVFAQAQDLLTTARPLPSAAMTINMLPAALALCIFQVPHARSRLRRAPFMAVCMLLLLACTFSPARKQTAPKADVTSGLLAKLDALESSFSTSITNAADNAGSAEVQQQQQQQRQSAAVLEALSDGSLDQIIKAAEEASVRSKDSQRSSFLVAVLPLLIGLLMRQAPVISVRARWRQSRSGVIAGVCLGFILCMAAPARAEISRCPAVRTICAAKLPAAGKAAQPPAMPAAPPKTPAVTAQESAKPKPVVSPPAPVPRPPPPPPPTYTDTLLAAMGARKEAMHIASTPDDVPQRVDPVPMTPRLSKAAEQQMYSKLLAALMGTNSTDGALGNFTQTPGGVPVTDPRPPKPINTTAPTGPDGLLYLQNARLRVGMDPKKGGSLTYLSSPVMPAEWADVNLINTWDSGRLIQQSYYGCEDGSCWSDKPWRWNPVQGGSWQNDSPRLLFSSNVGGVISTSSIPRNWGSQGLIKDITMLTEARLMGSVVKVRFTMRYTGSAAHPPRHQEVPAVFVDRRLNILATYTGHKPWTNGPLSFIMPGQTGQYYKPTERWAAYVDSKSGFGLGIYTPVSDQLVAYRIGPENSTARHDCSYFAPLVTEAIQPDVEFSYDSYIAVGRVDEMRKWFGDIAASVQPNLAVQRRISLPSTYASAPTIVQAPMTTPRNLVQSTRIANRTISTGHTAINIRRIPRPGADRPNHRVPHYVKANTTARHQHAAPVVADDFFIPVMRSPQTVIIQTHDFSSRLRRAAEQIFMPFRRFAVLDMLPVMLPPMPVSVTVGRGQQLAKMAAKG